MSAGRKRNKILEYWEARKAARKSVAEKVEAKGHQGSRQGDSKKEH